MSILLHLLESGLDLYELTAREALTQVDNTIAARFPFSRTDDDGLQQLRQENAELRLYVAALIKLAVGGKLITAKDLVDCVVQLARDAEVTNSGFDGESLLAGSVLDQAKAGTLYSVVDGLGRFRVAKILAVESGGVHMCLFANHFPERPERISPAELTMGDPDSIEDRGVPHAALKRKAFLRMKPVLLGHYVVTADEQDALFKWRDRGGVFVG